MNQVVTEALTGENAESVTAASSAMSRFLASLSASKVITLLLLFIGCILAVRLILFAEKKLLGKSRIGSHLHNAIVSGTRLVLVFIVILLLAGTLGIDTSSLLTLFGVAALAVSLSLQDMLGNLASAITLLFGNAVHVGDYIDVDGIYGRVDLIGLFSTKIVTLEGHSVFIPNHKMTSTVVANYTENGKCSVEIRVSAGFSHGAGDVKRALVLAADVPHLLPDMPVETFLISYNANDITYLLRVWTTQEHYRETYHLLMERVKLAFDECGVQMSYPHVVVHSTD